jgi:hypothetical protein
MTAEDMECLADAIESDVVDLTECSELLKQDKRLVYLNFSLDAAIALIVRTNQALKADRESALVKEEEDAAAARGYTPDPEDRS